VLSNPAHRRAANRWCNINMNTHKSYNEILGHPHDFEVEYRILTEKEGGRKLPPHQGIRWDFFYPNDQQDKYGVFIIWPEFIDSNGDIILTTETPIAITGKALMWIINPERRSFHISRIKEGLIGYSMEGKRKVAECIVTKIVGLPTNPKTQEEQKKRKNISPNSG